MGQEKGVVRLQTKKPESSHTGNVMMPCLFHLFQGKEKESVESVAAAMNEVEVEMPVAAMVGCGPGGGGDLAR